MLTRNATWPGPNHGVILPPRPKDEGSELLAEIEAFARRHGITVARICLAATGNGNMAQRLRDGLKPKPVTVNRLRRWMQWFEDRASSSGAIGQKGTSGE